MQGAYFFLWRSPLLPDNTCLRFFVPTTSASSGPESSHNSLLTVAVGSSGIKSDFFLPRICNPSKLCVQESFWILWSAKAMSTTYDYYYYDTYGTSTTWISSSTEASVAGSECEFQLSFELKEVGRKCKWNLFPGLNYIYLVWVYFLFYVGWSL